MSYYLYDADGVYVGPLPDDKGKQLLAERKAKPHGEIEKRKRARHIRLCEASVEQYSTDYGAKQKVFYRERFNGDRRGSQIVVLKRYDESHGKFYKWDNSLTFDQLRSGVGEPRTHERREATLSAL